MDELVLIGTTKRRKIAEGVFYAWGTFGFALVIFAAHRTTAVEARLEVA
jgi:hypothetical protein